MKYHLLVKLLKFLVYAKRFFWGLGSGMILLLGVIFKPIWKLIGYLHYKADYIWQKFIAVTGLNSQFLKRDNLQVIIFLVLLAAAIPHTVFYTAKSASLPGQKTIAYSLTGSDEDYSIEEVTANNSLPFTPTSPNWKEGVLTSEQYAGSGISAQNQDLAGIMAGGTAFSKPVLQPGFLAAGTRDQIISYEVQVGDSLSGIAYKYGISISTLLWTNNLKLNSYIRPGDSLKILPITGVVHTIKKGDNIKKIAVLYGAKQEDIIRFNKLKVDGSDLIIGESIIIPDGVKPQVKVPAVLTTREKTALSRVAAPPASAGLPSVSGFVWPSAPRMVTQYYSWKHHGLDIAGPYLSANYAAKAGTVITSQCGWNSGYGCYIIIDHGGGVKTLYGHNAKLLVSPGDYVSAGQTIGLMGNTGNVRGITGIHLHFEIQINGVKVNPLGYVR